MTDSRGEQEEWVLAFDGSCDTCSAVSAAVAEASGGKLSVLPLAHPQVREWRQGSMGPSPAWTPTLLHVRGDAIRAWTGPALSFVLARRLGPRSSMGVLRALGKLKEEVSHSQPTVTDAGVSRKRFLHLVGGVTAAIGLVMTGQTSAFARASENAKAEAWVQANMSQLPRTYEAIVRHPIPYRKAIYQAISPQERSQAWLEHFAKLRAERPDLSATQERVFRDLVELTPRVFASPARHTAELRALSERARRAFGVEGAYALIARLGPPDARSARRGDCDCSRGDGYWCLFHGATKCGPISCNPQDGCGDLWNERCNGICY
ncbi:bacteriocin fulvocin C-related protein [Streptomyces tubercidicus]